jgi:four helix bundle protein
MKRTKLQDPSPREAPTSNVQPTEYFSLDWGANQQAMILNDGPSTISQNRHPFDLLERTAKFGEAIVRFSKKVPRSPTNDRLIGQLVGCGTTVGANYCEANEGVSKKDFRHPISRCVKEAKETMFFLRMIVASEPQFTAEARDLYREANELLRIFASMYRKK